MNIWLTSRKGFLGEELTPRLSNKYNIFFSTRETVNLLNGNAVDSFILNNKIDIILHNAIKGGRRTKSDDASIVYENILMYENIAKNFNKVDKIINFDSAACFDRKQNIYNFKEECLGKFIPEDFYGFSKMNIALRSLQVKNSYNLRIFNCFGEKETEDRMTKANLIRYINNDPIIIHKNKFMDLFYISDLFIVLEYFLNNTYLPKDLNLVYEQKNTLLDIANIINSLENKKSQIIINQDGMDNSYTGDFSLINSLNFNFFGLKYGIKSMFSALLERGCKH